MDSDSRVQCGVIQHNIVSRPRKYYSNFLEFAIQQSGEWVLEFCLPHGTGDEIRRQCVDPKEIAKQERSLAVFGINFWRTNYEVKLVGMDLSNPARMEYRSDPKTMAKLFHIYPIKTSMFRKLKNFWRSWKASVAEN